MPQEPPQDDFDELLNQMRAEMEVEEEDTLLEKGWGVIKKGAGVAKKGLDIAIERDRALRARNRELGIQPTPNPMGPWWLGISGVGGVGTTTSIARASGMPRVAKGIERTAGKVLGRRQKGELISRSAQQGAARSIPHERAATSALTAEKAAIQANQAKRVAEATRAREAALRSERAARIESLATPTRINRALQAERAGAPRLARATQQAQRAQDISTRATNLAGGTASTARGQAQIASIVDETRQFSPLYQQGVSVWRRNLEASMNPSELNRFMITLPSELARNEIRLGMLEGFRETVANVPRLTKATQQHLLSPAGRAALRETLHGMPDEIFDQFMMLIQRGQFSEVRNWALKIAAIIPALRYVGAKVWRAVLMAGR